MPSDPATGSARPNRRRLKTEPGLAGVVYVVGEREEPAGPVKIGITSSTGSRAGRGGLNGGNWRTLYQEHTRVVPWPELRWFEWQVHRALMPWHVRGEWFDVRTLARQLGGWNQMLDGAIAGTIPGASSCAVEHGDHRLLTVARHRPKQPMQSTARCSCGEELEGTPGSAFITVLRQFAAEHLGLDEETSTELTGRLPGRAAPSRKDPTPNGSSGASTRRRR